MKWFSISICIVSVKQNEIETIFIYVLFQCIIIFHDLFFTVTFCCIYGGHLPFCWYLLLYHLVCELKKVPQREVFFICSWIWCAVWWSLQNWELLEEDWCSGNFTSCTEVPHAALYFVPVQGQSYYKVMICHSVQFALCSFCSFDWPWKNWFHCISLWQHVVLWFHFL